MSQLTDCINNLSAENILRGATKKGPPFYINVLGLTNYCDEFQAILDVYVPTIPDDTQLEAQNTLCCGLVDDGVWAKLDCFYVFANGDSPNCLLNWINPGTFTVTAVNFPLFTAWEGITGSNTKYLNTHWNPSNDGINFTQNSASFGLYSRTNVNDDNYDMGADDGTAINACHLFTSFSGGTLALVRINCNTFGSGASADSSGLFIANRTAANVCDCYRNKIQIVDDIDASDGLTNHDFYILAANNNGSPSTSCNKQISMAFMGGGFTQDDIDNLTDRFETYMDFLGKGVI